MNKIINEMLKKYNYDNILDEKNAIKEILQELTLSALAKTDFFDICVFCGGTALRIFYNLDRFSEDLDFSLKTQVNDFDFTKYIDVIKKHLKSYGIDCDISVKKKNKFSNIEPALLKTNTVEQLIYFENRFSLAGVDKNELIKIKLEIDCNPPRGGEFEYKINLTPDVYETCIYDLPSLFAGKIHSILCRFDDKNVKGRDLYDFIFYISKNVKPNMVFLKNVMVQTKHLKDTDEINIDVLKTMLDKRFDIIDYDLAIADVLRFIRNKDQLKYWNSTFFKELTTRI